MSGMKGNAPPAEAGSPNAFCLRASIPSCLRSSPTRSRSRGFTLLEMLTTVAVLIILLGLMVDLAGYVRNRSATDLSRQVLGALDVAMAEYVSKAGKEPEKYPPIAAFTNTTELSEDEQTLLDNARQNNRDFVAAMESQGLLKREPFASLPVLIFDRATLNDAWHTPIVFVPESHSRIGMAPSGKGFFFSAGPDRLYKTREDNLYSYEVRRVVD
jgi:prepilin-type N-terminal cleavage/methylation domain-containing protein